MMRLVPRWWLLLLWLVSLVAEPAASRADQPSSRGAAALVNGKPIPIKSVQELAEQIAQRAQTALDQVWADALDQLVTVEVLVQQARAQGVQVSDAEVEKEIRDLRSMGAGHPLAEWVQKTPLAEVREEVRRSLLVEKLLARVIKVEVGRKQVEDYYHEHLDRFQRPPMVRASHILIKIENGDRDQARKRAQELLARLQQGEDFAALARQVSQDPLTRDKGGDLGFFPEHPTPVAQAAFRLKVGELSDLVESPYGLHILKVTDKRPAGLAPLAEVFDEIRNMLEEDEQEEREEQLVQQLKQKAKIQILQDRPPAAKPASQSN